MEHRSPRTAAGGLSQRQGMGILFGVYLSFGLSPLYWNLLHGVSALEMVSHRSLWGSLIIAAFMVWKGQFPAFFRRDQGSARDRAYRFVQPRPSLELVDIHMGRHQRQGARMQHGTLHRSYDQHDTGLSVFQGASGPPQWMGIIFAGIGVLILLMGMEPSRGPH